MSAVLIVAFVCPGSDERAMLTLSLFRDGTFTGANTVRLLIDARALRLHLLLMSIYLQSIRGYSALRPGATSW